MRTIKNYRQAMDYLEEMASLGSVPGLASIKELCRRLGNPQDSLKFVHVAGTNGKGSTIAFISSVLRAAKIKAAVYTSPAVMEYTERYVCDGKQISQVCFTQLLARVANCCEQMQQEGLPHPTVFEMETALFFLFCVEKQVQLAILETGMGGALDATNLVQNTLVCVFPSISMDHMSFLGKNLTEIATQKAGILKVGARAVSIWQSDEVCSVLGEACKRMQVPLAMAEPSCVTKFRTGMKGGSFTYQRDGEKLGIKISLPGAYQKENAVLCIKTIEVLRSLGYTISDEALLQGLAKASWPGRFMIFPGRPTFVLDGAHNEDAARQLRASIEEVFGDRRRIFIMGVFADKEYEKVIAQTAELADEVLTLTPPSPRALPAYELAKAVQVYNGHVTAVDSCEEAMEVARLMARPEDVVIAFGSLSFLGRLRRLIEGAKVAPKHRTCVP